ncbi:MAG: S9 family peptidase [Bacteroidetes bacterium]|nr:MAG: S9 family peptidase [Bacteroidota bacterium]
MMKNKLFLFTLFFFSITYYSLGQNQDLTLEKIYSKREFATKGFGPARWLADGIGYTTLELSKKTEGKDIVKYNPETGSRSVLVNAASLIPKGKDKPLEIRNYIWSEDGEKLLIFTNTRRVWRYHTRGDYWVLNLKSGKLQQIGKTLKPTTLQFAKFSPDSKKVAFVSEQNIYVEDLLSEIITPLTVDGGDNIINGTFDWVYEEELNLRDGIRWSPDSKKVAFWKMDTEGIGTFYMINNLDSIYPKLIPIPYPKVGTTNSASKIGVVNIENKKTTWMNIPGDSRNHYLARMDWAHSSDELIIQQLNRAQNTNKVYFADSETGTTKVIHTEKVDTWLDVYDDLDWLDKGNSFTWRSDKTGWLHLYQVSRDGKKIKAITQGDFEVIELLTVDKKSGWVYYIATPNIPTERYLFRSKINGKGKPQQLSPVDKNGYHSYIISPDGKYAIHTFSNTKTPPEIDVVSLPDHKTLRVLEDNSELKEKLSQYNIPQKEFFKLNITNDLVFDGWMIKPLDFDSTKKYPVLFYVYGEPAGSTVKNNFGRDLWHEFLAQQGYIVISVDNRGTNVPRGREWRKSIYRKIGIIATEDQAAAAKKIQEWDFVDSDRIGIWGWSGGGSMTLNCMFKYPEIYKTGIAIAFISHQKFYDTIYQERYMDQPKNNEEGYEQGSPITHAKNLEGNLLLIHGSGDDNCHYQNCEMLVNELIKYNKYFSMIEYPMRSHGIYERENTSLHLRMTMFNYLKLNLPTGAK